MVWRLRKCFCGFSLKSSCIATAIILIIFCCAALVSEISVLATNNKLTGNETLGGYVVIAVIALIMLPSSILLLYGVRKDTQRPVWIWFAITVTLFVPKIVGMFLNIDEGFIVYMLSCCALAVELYMMALVYSYLVELNQLKSRKVRAVPSLSAEPSTSLDTRHSPRRRVPVMDAAYDDCGSGPGPSQRCVQRAEVVTHAPPPPPPASQLTVLEEDELEYAAGAPRGAGAVALAASTLYRST